MKNEVSAGGIVLKSAGGEVYILMAQHAQHHGWGFPKGHIGDTFADETEQQTAIREVKEETGVEAEIIEKASEETYIYTWNGEKRNKTVHYYFMKYIGGNFKDKDHEMEAVEWVKLDEVEEKITYANAKLMFRKLLPQIQELVKKI
jgi:8-oxo-dGTP diphosphatase